MPCFIATNLSRLQYVFARYVVYDLALPETSNPRKIDRDQKMHNACTPVRSIICSPQNA